MNGSTSALLAAAASSLLALGHDQGAPRPPLDEVHRGRQALLDQRHGRQPAELPARHHDVGDRPVEAEVLDPEAGPSVTAGMIAGGGNWLHSFFLADIVPAMQIELATLVHTQTTAVSDAWAGTSWLELYTALGDVVGTLIIGTSMMLFIFLCLVVIYAVTYAQVIWAHMAMLILTFVGPMMIPWLVFEPMAFLFWGWFRSMITFALYGAMAGAIMRVFMSVCLGYITTFSQVSDIESPVQMVSWVLILLPLMVAGVLSSLKVGELAGMLVSGGGGGGAGMTGALMMAATGGKAMLAGKAAGAAGGK